MFCFQSSKKIEQSINKNKKCAINSALKYNEYSFLRIGFNFQHLTRG